MGVIDVDGLVKKFGEFTAVNQVNFSVQRGEIDRRRSIVKTFSGGMKCRLEIARGLLHHPKVLFLDEPTVGLDPQTGNAIWQHVHRLRDAEGVTIFMTTHYMDEAEMWTGGGRR